MSHALFKKNDDTLGNILRRTRRAAGLELEQVAVDTSISVRNLLYLERNDFDGIPEEVYRLHTLKTYSQYLGINWNKISLLYKVGGGKSRSKKESITVTTAISKKHFWDSVDIVRNTAFALLAIGGLGILCFMGYSATLPPRLTIENPLSDMISKDEKITVAGMAPGAVALKINGEAISLDRDGRFSQQVTLQAGMNTIAISAQKKYSREALATRKVLWSAPVAITPHNNDN